MGRKQLKVTLLRHTPDPQGLVAQAAHECYSDGESEIKDVEHRDRLIRQVIKSGHTSVLEHVTFTFRVENVSRSESHQQVRHRMASYSQQSQRYVKMTETSYIMPPSIAENPVLAAQYEELMEDIWLFYNRAAGLVPKEDARYVLPNACTTRFVVTMNVRSLFNFLELRACNHAQWEIRAVAEEMYRQLMEVAPVIFETAGPRCKRGEKCREAKPCRK